MSQFPVHSSGPPTRAADGHGRVPQAEVGDGRREPAGPVEERGGALAAALQVRMAAAVGGERVNMAAVVRMLGDPAQPEGREGRARAANARGPADQPRALVDNYLQTFRYYLQRYAVAQGMFPAGRAHHAARHVPYPLDLQRVDLDNLSSAIAMMASEVIDPLIRELGCDVFFFRQ